MSEEIKDVVLEDEKAEQDAKKTQKELIEEFGKGKIELTAPIRGHGEDICELEFDFTQFSGYEYVKAMEADNSAQNAFRISYKQALSLFAAAAAKCDKRLDAKDIMQRIGCADAIAAVQAATVFFNVSNLAARKLSSKK